MKIAIAERLRPFSHVPGIACMLPGSPYSLQIFPTLLRLHELTSSQPKVIGEAALSLTGPVKDFTVVQDLERCEVKVYGYAQEGYFCYHCCASDEGMRIDLKKGEVPIHVQSERMQVGAAALPAKPLERLSLERLSLGWHKAQDWTQMRQRLALEELLPLWFCLGQLTPKPASHLHEGSALLLNACRELVAKREREALAPAFQKLFLAAFSGIFVPRLEDSQHQGFGLPPLSGQCRLSPLILLAEGADLIRSLFVQQDGHALSILPALPPQFHCGRLIGLKCSLGTLDLEWSKKQIRRLIFRAMKEGPVRFLFQRGLKEFRLREGSSKKFILCGETLSMDKGKEYYLDNFRH